MFNEPNAMSEARLNSTNNCLPTKFRADAGVSLHHALAELRDWVSRDMEKSVWLLETSA